MQKNVNQSSKSGAAPAREAGQGETLIGISFQHDLVTEDVAGSPVKVVAPCEGTGYEIGSISLIKGARNLDNAKSFYDWGLTPQAQAIGAEQKSFQVPPNKGTPLPAPAPNFAAIQLTTYDFAQYASSPR